MTTIVVPAGLSATPIDTATVLAAAGQVGAYVIALSAVVFAALVFRYGFMTVWNALKSALHIGSRAAKVK